MDNTSQLIAQSLSDGECGNSGVIKNSEALSASKSEYEIPNRYFIDTLTLLPINPQNSYLYWEVSDATLEKFGIPLFDVHLIISIFDENNIEVSSFPTQFSVGNYYLKHKTKSKSLIAKLHLKVGENSFVTLGVSNTIKLFDTRLKGDRVSPLLSEYIFEGENIKEEDKEIVHFNSISLLKNKNLSSQTMLIKETR